MSFIAPFIAALALASFPPSDECFLPPVPRAEPWVFTNADLDRMAACRYQTGAQSERGVPSPGAAPRPGRRTTASPSPATGRRLEPLESDWRAQWRSVDQRVRQLRREARELRQEAAEAPRDEKKRPTGRRSPSLLLSRARNLEAEAKELEDEFQERARRQGALPGWLRPPAR
jgi:hypothetical protein